MALLHHPRSLLFFFSAAAPALLLLLLLLLPFSSHALPPPNNIIPPHQAHHHHHQPSPPASAVSIVGTVFCDHCFHQHFSKHSAFLPGATVAIECKHRKSPTVRVEASTDQYGAFDLLLPPSIVHSPKRLRRCIVHLVKSPNKFCSVKAASTSSKAFTAMTLKSKQGRSYIYTAGALSYQPKSLPSFCTSNEFMKTVSTAAVASQQKNTYSQSADIPLPFVPPFGLPLPPFLPLPIPPIPGITPPPSLPGLPPIPIPNPTPLMPPIPFLTPPPLIPGLPVPPIPFMPPLPPLPMVPLPPLASTEIDRPKP